MSWVKATGMTRKPNRSVIFLTMKIRREHKTLPHSNAACHKLTLLSGGKKFTHAYEGKKSPHGSALHQAFAKK